MDDFLERIGIRETARWEFSVNGNDFFRILDSHVDEDGFDFFEAFSGGNSYKGTVDHNGFEIRKKRKFFNSYYTMAKCKGTYLPNNSSKLLVDVEIKPSNWFLIPYLLIVPIYAVVLTGVFFSESSKPWSFAPIVLMHAVFMIGIPFFICKRSVSALAYDLERDLHFMLKDVQRPSN